VQRGARLVIGEARPGPEAIARGMEKGERLVFGQALAMPKEPVHVEIRRPPVAVPDFHGFAALSGHPASDQEAAYLIEVHWPPRAVGLATIHRTWEERLDRLDQRLEDLVAELQRV
jgi:hypothetical protein